MAGYREHSFDPNAFEGQGVPMRPFNWVQWLGIAFALTGIAIDFLYFADRAQWVRLPFATPTLAVGPLVLGVTLINSRRQAHTDLAPELAADRKRWLIITVIICVAVLGVAAILDLQGAS